MSSTPEFTHAEGLTSAEFLAERLRKAYRSVTIDSMDEVASLYATDLYFEDPSHGIHGRAAFIDYFENMVEDLNQCDFQFHQTLVSDTEIFTTWTLLIKHPKLRGGKTIHVEGASFLRTRNGKIFYHRDYFDMGAMLYEHLPIIGRIISRIKQRLGQ